MVQIMERFRCEWVDQSVQLTNHLLVPTRTWFLILKKQLLCINEEYRNRKNDYSIKKQKLGCVNQPRQDVSNAKPGDAVLYCNPPALGL